MPAGRQVLPWTISRSAGNPVMLADPARARAGCGGGAACCRRRRHPVRIHRVRGGGAYSATIVERLELRRQGPARAGKRHTGRFWWGLLYAALRGVFGVVDQSDAPPGDHR